MRTSYQPPPNLVPAAEYVRMSDEAQQYSIENQQAAIREYAASHGFEVVKTYADPGRSGVTAKHRPALAQLLKDVVKGEPGFNAILVYDVSRWGRFTNADEAAHYEFLCADSGIPLHYCAEPFQNDGTPSSSMLKALKRGMASEFSRELGEKVIRGKTRLVQLGFWVGGPAGYAYRRMMVSKDGKRMKLLKFGEHKSLTSDRVILVRGDRREVKIVQLIFSMAVQGLGTGEIARRLNQEGITRRGGRPWERVYVRNILNNPKYAGCNVWNRFSRRLRTNRVAIDKRNWIMKPEAFDAIVDEKTFEMAQAALPKRENALWSDAEMLKKLKRLLGAKGRLSLSIIEKARGMPCTTTLFYRFGSYRNMYRSLGLHVPDIDAFGKEQQEPTLRLRRRVVTKIRDLFPGKVTITHLPRRVRSMLRIDDSFLVSVLICPREQRHARRFWRVKINSAEREYITLVCKLDAAFRRIVSYHLLPNANTSWQCHPSYKDDPWLRAGVRLSGLPEFYATAKRLWNNRRASSSVREKDSV
jgi:DNA invertase Pin-like site-specific DNA recombinase